MGRRLAWVGLVAFAVAGIAWAVAAPGERSFVAGGEAYGPPPFP
jgi:hypothetical protein